MLLTPEVYEMPETALPKRQRRSYQVRNRNALARSLSVLALHLLLISRIRPFAPLFLVMISVHTDRYPIFAGNERSDTQSRGAVHQK